MKNESRIHFVELIQPYSLNIKAHIPNTLTLFNLLSGCVGIVFAFKGNLYISSGLIWIAAVFDFLDGFSARILKVASPTGKELDSLADMVTFGVLPSIIVFQLIGSLSENIILPYIAFSIALFSALRLAKFNIDDRQSDQFIGLPTPACAFFVSAIPFVLDKYFINLNNSIVTGSLVAISFVLSLLLVAELPLFSLKFKNFKWENNEIRFIFVGVSVIILFVLKIVALPVIIIIYILLSLFNLKTSK